MTRTNENATGSVADTFYVDETDREPDGPMPYADACALVNERCDELESDGWSADRSWASSGNYYAACVTRGTERRMIAVERADELTHAHRGSGPRPVPLRVKKKLSTGRWTGSVWIFLLLDI